jgi:hypothetical protein
MKGLYTNSTRVSEPIAKGTLSGYGIGCLGGFVDKGIATFYEVIGGKIEFDPEALEGKISLIRQPKLLWNSMAYGQWNDALAKLRHEQRRTISKKLIELSNTTKKAKATISNQLKILNQFKFKAFIQTSNIAGVIKSIYNSKWTKQMVDFSEEFIAFSFCKKGTQIPAQGTIDRGLDYYVGSVTNSQSQITRIRVNKGIWLAWCRHVGYDHRAAALEWIRLHDVYGNAGDHTIDVEAMLDAIFDEISKRPTLSEIPDLAAYIADTLIGIALYNLTVAGISAPEWFVDVPFALIMENISDKQVTAAIKVITEEWKLTQVVLPGSDLPPKRDLNIMPFWDGSILHKEMPQPCIGLCELDFGAQDYEERDEEGTVKKQSASKLKLVQIVTVNASPDGSENPNHILFNRIIGPLASLSDDGRLSHICVDAVYPWILGLQQPDESNVHLERRHWPLVYLHSVFDEPPVAAESLIEAMLVGLKTFLGPHYYLINLEELLKTSPLDVLLSDKKGEEKMSTISGTLFSEKITWK